MVSIFDEELERQRQQLEAVGVTPQMTQIAAATPDMISEDNLLQAPKTPMEEMMERDGKGKTIGKMLLGGFTGLTPLLFPGMASAKERYKQDYEAYTDQQKQLRMQEQAKVYQGMLYDDDPSNDIKALQMGAIMQPEIYGPVLRDNMQNQFNPDPETFTEGEYQLNPQTGRWEYRMQGNRGTINTVEMDEGFMPETRMWSADAREAAIGEVDNQVLESDQRLADVSSLGRTMDEIGEENWTAGLQGRLGEEWKQLSGAEDALSMARRQYTRIRNTKAVQNLPPGVASDKDIDLVMSGFPTEFTNFAELRQYVRDMEKVEQKISAYRNFESKWITDKGTRAGLLSAWKKEQAGLAKSPQSPFYDDDAVSKEQKISSDFDAMWPEAAGRE